MSGPAELTGRCNCGAVTFVAVGPFRPAKACHCKTCRRQSGHFIAATQIDRADLAVTGSEALAWYSASETARRGFCKICGAHLFWEPQARIASRSSWAASTSRPGSSWRTISS